MVGLQNSDAARGAVLTRHGQFRSSATHVLALTYLSKMTDKNGTAVDRFVPGFWLAPWPRQNLSAQCAVVRLAGGVEVYLIPRTPWRAMDRYVMDIASLEFGTFRIEPVGP